MLSRLVSAFLVSLITVCAGGGSNVRYVNRVQASVSARIKTAQRARQHLIFQFELTDPDFQTERAASNKAMNQAFVTGIFESQLLAAGFSLVDRARLPDVLRELELAESGLTQDSAIRIGKFMSAQVIVVATVPINRNLPANQSGSTVLNIKALDVETTSILWKLDLNCQRLGDMRSNSALHAQRSLETCFQEGLAKLPQ